MTEEWSPVPGYEGFYEITDQGAVRSVSRRVAGVSGSLRLLPSRPVRSWVSRGYPVVTLYKDNRGKNHRVHRLVLATFRGPCPGGMEGCHNDGDRLNSRLENLRWDTRESNQADRERHGTNRQRYCKRNHEFTPANTKIRRSDGAQICLACKEQRVSERRVQGVSS